MKFAQLIAVSKNIFVQFDINSLYIFRSIFKFVIFIVKNIRKLNRNEFKLLNRLC